MVAYSVWLGAAQGAFRLISDGETSFVADVAEPTREGSEAGERICWKCGETYGSHLQYCPEDGAQLVELDPTDEGDLLVGTVFDDRFRILSVLGEGGMSRVYHARQVDNEEHVALKILKADFLRDEEIRKRFMYEARVIAGLDHPAAVDLHDFGQAPDGSFYMVMELLEGESLADRLRRRFISYEEIFAFTIPTCGVMAEAHRDDVIHRDLKPENIFLTHIEQETDQPKLLDFGIAKHLRMGTMTQSDARWGTPAYMSPEQASGDPVQGTADVYALGVMLYELIAGVLPFRASTAMGFAVKHMHRDVTPIRQLPGMEAHVPTELDELVCEMMAKEPESRPGSMQEVQQRLEAARDAEMMVSMLSTTPGEHLNRDEIDLDPDDADDGGDEAGGVEVDEELKSAHTVFVGDEDEGAPVDGDHVASLQDAEARGASGGVGPHSPTPTGGMARQTPDAQAVRDTAEIEGVLPGDHRLWWAAAAVVAGAFAAYLVVGGMVVTPERSTETAAASGGDEAMVLGQDAGGTVAENDDESSAEKERAATSKAVGTAASLAARMAMRARSVAMKAGREVQAMPKPESTQSASSQRADSQPSRPATRETTEESGTSTGGSGEESSEKTTDKTESDESVREALETTF